MRKYYREVMPSEPERFSHLLIPLTFLQITSFPSKRKKEEEDKKDHQWHWYWDWCPTCSSWYWWWWWWWWRSLQERRTQTTFTIRARTRRFRNKMDSRSESHSRARNRSSSTIPRSLPAIVASPSPQPPTIPSFLSSAPKSMRSLSSPSTPPPPFRYGHWFYRVLLFNRGICLGCLTHFVNWGRLGLAGDFMNFLSSLVGAFDSVCLGFCFDWWKYIGLLLIFSILMLMVRFHVERRRKTPTFSAPDGFVKEDLVVSFIGFIETLLLIRCAPRILFILFFYVTVDLVNAVWHGYWIFVIKLNYSS